MNFFKNPEWIANYNFPYASFEEIPQTVFDDINTGLDKLQSDKPLVSIVIPAWNEEVNILKCMASFSNMATKHPFEIIVVNNNSKDKTQKTLDKLHIKSFFEGVQGTGPARQTGQENALGKYILLADADCLYPEDWMDEMIKVLQEPGVVCVYGRYSFISEPGFQRWKLALLEKSKDFIAEIRHMNRPYYNSYGISMGYIAEYGLKEGFIKEYYWGEDGKMCMDLMKYGKIKQVKSSRARVWTAPRTLQRDGNFFQAILSRLKKEISNFSMNFHTKPPKNDVLKEHYEKKNEA